MELNTSEQIKILLKREKVRQKEMADALTARTGKIYTPGSFFQKMNRNTITHDEFIIIADILGYDVIVKKRDD